MTKILPLERWQYNAYDCLATFQAYQVLSGYLKDTPAHRVYRAEMALEPCVLAIGERGVRIDKNVQQALLDKLDYEIAHETDSLDLNPNSTKQVRQFFYDDVGLEEMRNKDGRVSVDKSILERIANGNVKFKERQQRGKKQEAVDRAADMARRVLYIRTLVKDKGMVDAKLKKGRIHTKLNVGATESFRFSATQTNLFNYGANLQQVRHDLRAMMVPDPGMEFVYCDQDRAESTVVAFESGDEAYIQAHLKGDTHMQVARMIWPDAGWTGDDEEDLIIAKRPNFIGLHSRRDLSKRVQHGSNYGGKHRTMARILHISEAEAEAIQHAYFNAFPGIREWQERITEEVKRYKSIKHRDGYIRAFFNRSWDEATFRQAMSYIPQRKVAWTTHIVMFLVWRILDRAGIFEILLHNHDALLYQCLEGTWESVWLPMVQDIQNSIVWTGANDVEYAIPWSWQIGKNWMECS